VEFIGAFMVSMPAKFGHPQCPNVGDSQITNIWTLGMPTGFMGVARIFDWGSPVYNVVAGPA